MNISPQQQRKKEKIINALKVKAKSGSIYALEKLDKEWNIISDNMPYLQEVCGEPPFNS